MRFGLSDQTIERIQGVFSGHPEITEAILYGSRAKGNHKPGSDIDLSLKGANLNLLKLAKINHELDELSLPFIFDFSLYDQIQNSDLLDHIKRVGTIFYSNAAE